MHRQLLVYFDGKMHLHTCFNARIEFDIGCVKFLVVLWNPFGVICNDAQVGLRHCDGKLNFEMDFQSGQINGVGSSCHIFLRVMLSLARRHAFWVNEYHLNLNFKLAKPPPTQALVSSNFAGTIFVTLLQNTSTFKG